MKHTYIKLILVLLFSIFFGSYLLYKIPLPVAQDLARQIVNGRDILSGNFAVLTQNVYSYVSPTQPFANHHWLYGVIAYLLHASIGFVGIVILKVLLFFLLFYILWQIVSPRANFFLFAFFSIPTMLMLIARSDFRPELFSYLFIAVFIWTLTKGKENPYSKRIFWLVPLQLLWVNIHIYFPIGLFIIAGFLVEEVVLGFKKLKQNIYVQRLALLLIFSAFTVFLNPYGLMGMIRSLVVNTDKNFPIASSELGSLADVFKYSPRIENLGTIPFLYMIGLLAMSFVVVLIYRYKKKMPPFKHQYFFYLAASTATAILGYSIIRSLPLFGIIFLLAITTNLQELLEALQVWIKKAYSAFYNALSWVAVTVLIVLPVLYMTFFMRQIISPYNYFGAGLTPHSQAAADFFIANDLKGPIFNDTDVGSYLIYNLYPREKVFTDNRFGDAYSADFFTKYNATIQDETMWHSALERFNFNTIFFYQYDGGDDVRNFLFRRFYDPEWVLVFADNYNIVFVRNNEQNKAIIEKFAITNDNMTERLAPLLESKDPRDYLAAADIYSLFGRVNLAMDQYLRFLSFVPSRGKVWTVLGKMELTRGDQQYADPYRALIYLQNAVNAGWVTTDSLSYLALAYYRIGDVPKAKALVAREEKLNPDSKDVLDWKKAFIEYDLRQKN